MNITAIALLVVKPNDTWCSFINTFTSNYKVYIIVDSNNMNIEEYRSKYPDINFIQINDAESVENGFDNSSYPISKHPISWDKALYYFSRKNTKHDFVWFIEEDVYIPSKDSLISLDSQYNTTDLICNQSGKNMDGNSDGWPHWGQWITMYLSHVENIIRENKRFYYYT
jgi:hypothetical protein